jgi:hypothetical protein
MIIAKNQQKKSVLIRENQWIKAKKICVNP